MGTLESTDFSDMQTLITERNNCVPSIISTVNDVDSSILLENIKLCIKYLPTYSISNVVEELLQYIVPVIKKFLFKIYEDNFLLSDTVDDDIILGILKVNLQNATEFLQVIKTILDFLFKNKEINLRSLDNVPLIVAEMILFSFEHCRNRYCMKYILKVNNKLSFLSGDLYKTTFNTELLDIFRLTQEVHLLFLKLFETCIVIKSDNEIKELSKVLEIVCNMSEVLSEISIKSMSDNWKGYIAIVQKFTTLLSEAMDLRLPIKSLTFLLTKHLTSLDSLNIEDPKQFTQVVKIAGFLLKVVLKIFDIFWNHLEKITQELLFLCCNIYCYPVNAYDSEKSPEALNLIEVSLYKPLEPFLLRLVSGPLFGKIFSLEPDSGYTFGYIIFLSNILKQLVVSEGRPENFQISPIILAIFTNIKLCYADFFNENQSTLGIFDNLVLNITASILVYDNYREVERILFENILQEHIWSALLAIEVWTLVLQNSTPQVSLETLLNLIKKCEEIDFGLYTNRLEQIYLKCLMQRIFKILPVHMKYEIISKFNINRNIQIWKMIGLHDFPIQRKSVIEDMCGYVVEMIETVDRNNFSSKNFTSLGEHLEVLSTANFSQLRVNCTRLANSVHNLWQFNSHPDLINNNAFKYFISKLSKITSTLILEFNTKELITILTQLKFISSDDSYKLLVCEILSSSAKRPTLYNQDENKITTLVSEIMYPNLLCTQNSVIKQKVLEVVHKFTINSKHDIVKATTRTSNQMQNEISNYLQKNVAESKFDREYLTTLGSFRFQHECITWKNPNTLQPLLKKQKITEPAFVQESRTVKEKQVNERLEPPIKKSVVPEIEAKPFQSHDAADESVSEVIANIKGEVKSLVNVLKTEKLSKKNASDIKLIANHLLSLL